MSVPTGTYRLQLRPGFDFADASALVDYLADLGVSHVYCSPYLQAVPGSSHGYDVVDPTRVSTGLGGEEGRRTLVEALGEAGLGQILDIVPNHMAAHTPENRWWWDVLENGPSSTAAPLFDIDWEAPEEKLRGQVLLPVLGDHYGRVLEAGEVVPEREGAVFRARYHDHLFPLSPRSVARILEAALERRDDAGSSPERAEAAFLSRSLRRLPVGTADGARRERAADLGVLRRRLQAVLAADPELARAVDGVLAGVAADPDRLDALMEAQHYRISYWRAGSRELVYRRFFDIDDLIGVRVEDPDVFARTHARILAWLRDGSLAGVRVDHPDGLRRPGEYFRRLRHAAPHAWIVAEKILEPGEAIPAHWPVDGTTGYDALNEVGALFVDPEGEAPLTDLYRSFTGDEATWEETARARKLQVLDEILPADVARLAQRFVEVCESRRRYRDFTRWALRETLREVAAAFPVYRTYVTSGGEASDEDEEVVEGAVRRAREHRPDLDGELFDLLEAILLGRTGGPAETELRMRFQQLTGPVMAKAVEDTAFYVWTRFVALNEVGGDPSRFGRAPLAFHERRRRTADRHPGTMTTLSTHDTKRSEDVRARLALLSEIPDRWGEAVRRWRERAGPHRSGPGRPDGTMEYLFWQTLVGAWPLPVERAVAYMRKAAREAKTHTSWLRPDDRYETSLEGFVRGVLGDDDLRREVGTLAGELTRPGRVTSLAQKLVQLTMPGVPDVYRGTELWDLSLVDPDNRRPVDFGLRRRLLAEVVERAGPDAPPEASPGPGSATTSSPGPGADPVERKVRPPPVSADPDEPGLPKLWVVRHALRLRRRRPELFGADAGYRPLQASGPAAGHALAFARGGGTVTVVPRLVLGLAARGGWEDTTLELPRPADPRGSGRWRNLLTGETWSPGPVRLGALLERFPLALLDSG